jgi:rhodanese-related sulfurtransferase
MYKKNMLKKILLLTLIFLAAGSQRALAIPPPDFIFTAGIQLMQFFSFALILLGSAYLAGIQFIKVFFYQIKLNWKIIIIGLIAVVALSGLATYIYKILNEKKAYSEWNAESQEYNNESGSTLINITPTAEITPSSTLTVDQTKSPYITKAVSNMEFKQILESGTQFVILDAREDEEYSIGNVPGSRHIRLADLYAGEWETLTKDIIIYVFCWSGIRGKEVADFLNGKGLQADYIAEGADGWVSSGGLWQGEIKFSKAYTDQEFTVLLNYDQVKSEEANGALIIDSRELERYTNWHIPNSINISIISTPSTQIDNILSQIPANSRIIAVCDDIVNCFDSRILGLKVEARGHEFLGRYNKPWEYRNNK